jgi:hypothetical protein
METLDLCVIIMKCNNKMRRVSIRILLPPSPVSEILSLIYRPVHMSLHTPWYSFPFFPDVVLPLLLPRPLNTSDIVRHHI